MKQTRGNIHQMICYTLVWICFGRENECSVSFIRCRLPGDWWRLFCHQYPSNAGSHSTISHFLWPSILFLFAWIWILWKKFSVKELDHGRGRTWFDYVKHDIRANVWSQNSNGNSFELRTDFKFGNEILSHSCSFVNLSNVSKTLGSSLNLRNFVMLTVNYLKCLSSMKFALLI